MESQEFGSRKSKNNDRESDPRNTPFPTQHTVQRTDTPYLTDRLYTAPAERNVYS